MKGNPAMLFTIGHSTHTPDDFLNIAQGLDVIVDVRSHPTSRWEWWRLEQMRQWLPQGGIAVEWMPSLGGWTKSHYERYHEQMAAVGVDLAVYSKGAFPKQRIGAARPANQQQDRQWTNQGLFDYAWFTSLVEYRLGLQVLVDKYGKPDQPKAAIMCCEALWWKCHRSMIADTLYELYNIDALHIKPRRPVRPTTSRWDNHSKFVADRIPRYPVAVREAWGKITT